ncbi:MAG TPA: YihY/virulence factor BrkB family protein [Roseomonas sp.]
MDIAPLPASPRDPVLTVARRVWIAAGSDRISLTAAGCAFYAMLALFPALSLVVSIYGAVFFDARTLEPQLDVLRRLLPPETYELIADRLHSLVSANTPGLGWGAAISVLVAFWSAGAGIRSLLSALNMAYGETERRGFLHFQALSLGITLAAMLVTAAAIALLVLAPTILHLLGAPRLHALALQGASLGTLLVVVFTGILVVYRFGPAGHRIWRRRLPGAAIATLIWAIASAAFSLYVSHLANYDSMYGPLGTAIGLLMWFYVSIYVVLLGAEVNVALDRRRDLLLAEDA